MQRDAAMLWCRVCRDAQQRCCASDAARRDVPAAQDMPRIAADTLAPCLLVYAAGYAALFRRFRVSLLSFA